MLQPHVGQTSCIPHPTEGVDNTVQDALQVLPGWFLPWESHISEGVGRYNISLAVAENSTGEIDDTFVQRLREYLQCEDGQPGCRITLSVDSRRRRLSSSTQLLAIVEDDVSATASAAARLMSLSASELYDSLGIAVEGAVTVVGGGALRLPTPENLVPVLCPQRESCLGGRNRTVCRDGHTGLLCGTCEEGHYWSKGVCSLCDGHAGPSVALFAGGLTAALGLAFLFMVVSARKSRRSAAKDAGAFQRTALSARMTKAQSQLRARCALGALLGKLRHRAMALGSIGKILLAYFQVLHTFSQLPSIRWPANFESFLGASAPLAFEIFSTYPLGCLLDGSRVTFTHELIGVLLLPLFGTVAVLLVALAAARCTLPRGERGLRTVAMRPETCTLQLWVLLLLYPSLAKTALVPFDCVEVGGRELLRANPSVACDDGGWHVLAALGGIGTVLYAFGFPLLCFLVTRASHREHTTLKEANRSAPSRRGSLQSEGGAGLEEASSADAFAQVIMRLHFERAKLLLRSYHESYWYWESLDIFRKYLLTSVVLVIAHDTLLQVYMGMMTCVGFALLVARHQPYASPMCGRVQMLALTQLTFTYGSGMLFFDDGGVTRPFGERNEERWGVILICLNVLSFVLLAIGLCGAVNGSVRDVQAELKRRQDEEQQLQQELLSMRSLLAEPPAGLKRARIEIDELSIGSRIGSGAFGAIYAGSWHGTPVAIKTMHEHHRTQLRAARAFRDEVLLLLELRHPNIVQLIGGSWDVELGQLCLVLELCPRGSLEAVLENTLLPLTWLGELLPIATGVARGMAYLHAQSPPIVHRDLKPANVLLEADLTPKVADMGTALEMTEGAEEDVANAGTPLFQAPEVLRKEAADHLCDVWSYACVLCSLATRTHPYEPVSPSEAVSLVEQLRLQPRLPQDSPLADVVAAAAEYFPENRPSFDQLLPMVEGADVVARARQTDAGRRLQAGGSAAATPGTQPPPGPSELPCPNSSAPDASCGSTSAAEKLSHNDSGDWINHSRPTKRSSASDASTPPGVESDEMTSEEKLRRRAETRLQRKHSLKAADSVASLFGHKAKPGRLTSRPRNTSVSGSGDELEA